MTVRAARLLMAAGLVLTSAAGVGATSADAAVTAPAEVAPPAGVTAPAVATPPAGEVDPVRAAEYWLDEYGVRTAWGTTKGKGTTIAIIDSATVNAENSTVRPAVVIVRISARSRSAPSASSSRYRLMISRV